jgi:hypothetical protein
MVKHLVNYFLLKVAKRGRTKSGVSDGNKPSKKPVKKQLGNCSVSYMNRFPWADEIRTIKRKNFTLTIYADNSRLYQFKDGGYLILTPEGVSIIKSQPRVIKRYLKGEKLFLVGGGNSNIYTFNVGGYPKIVKEHFAGDSALTQLEHAHAIKKALVEKRSYHSVPDYYAVASMPGKYIREISVMELMPGKKISDIIEELKSNPTADNMRRLHKLMDDYRALKKWLIKRKLPITDFHEGNILTTYAKDLRRYIFSIIDQ